MAAPLLLLLAACGGLTCAQAIDGGSITSSITTNAASLSASTLLHPRQRQLQRQRQQQPPQQPQQQQQKQAPVLEPPPSAAALQQQLRTRLPPWLTNRSGDFVLNFTAADAVARAQEGGAILFRGQPLPSVSHRKGYFHGNIAALRFGHQLVVAVRKIQFHLTPRSALQGYPPAAKPDQKWVSWWTSRISLCTADAASLQPLLCANYDPRTWSECMWNGGFEPLGPEDPRLILWPSKGLFMLFVSKPWPNNASGTGAADTACAGPWAQQPWLVPLLTYDSLASSSGGSGSSGGSTGQGAGAGGTAVAAAAAAAAGAGGQQRDPWTSSGVIRLQYVPQEWRGARLAERQRRHAAKYRASVLQGGVVGEGDGSRSSSSSDGVFVPPLLHKQKNWNPFIHRDELYFSQSFVPHVVIKPVPDGTCSEVAVTDGRPFAALPSRPRGNTQAVLVPSQLSGAQEPFYLGIVHTEVERRYSNHFYKMQAKPPFAITAVSAAPLPLKAGPHPRVPAWSHISFPMSLQLLEDSGQLMIGYGSGDQASRIRFMPLGEALGLFDGGDDTSGSNATASDGSSGDKERSEGAAGSSSSSSGSVPWSASAKAAAAAAVAVMEAAVRQQRQLLHRLQQLL